MYARLARLMAEHDSRAATPMHAMALHICPLTGHDCRQWTYASASAQQLCTAVALPLMALQIYPYASQFQGTVGAGLLFGKHAAHCVALSLRSRGKCLLQRDSIPVLLMR